MTRSLLGSGLLLAALVALGGCTTSWEEASAQSVVTDDGAHLVVSVRRVRVTKKQVVYASTSTDEISTELWLVPIPGMSTDSPLRLPNFSTPPRNFFTFYPMLTAGYWLVHHDNGTFVVDLETGESRSIGTEANYAVNIFVPSLDGSYIAHVARADEFVCEGYARPCELRVDILDAQTLELRASVPLTLPDPVWRADEIPVALYQRVAWTAEDSFRVTSVRTVDTSLDGLVREVPFEPCYLAPTSSGRVNRRDGLVYEQHVDDDGRFTDVTTTSVETSGGWPHGCLAEPRPAL